MVGILFTCYWQHTYAQSLDTGHTRVGIKFDGSFSCAGYFSEGAKPQTPNPKPLENPSTNRQKLIHENRRPMISETIKNTPPTTKYDFIIQCQASRYKLLSMA
jgi:hypothetical protein